MAERNGGKPTEAPLFPSPDCEDARAEGTPVNRAKIPQAARTESTPASETRGGWTPTEVH